MLTLFYIFDADSPFYFITTQDSLWFMITLSLPNLTQSVQNDSCASSAYVIYFQKCSHRAENVPLAPTKNSIH